MPCSYRIDKVHQVIVGIGSGIVTKNDLITYLRDMEHDPDFHESFDKIEMTQSITDLQVTNSDLQEIAEIIILQKSSRRAVVAEGDLIFGVSRMFEVYRGLSQEGNFHVFRTTDNAMHWINEGRIERQVKPISFSHINISIVP